MSTLSNSWEHHIHIVGILRPPFLLSCISCIVFSSLSLNAIIYWVQPLWVCGHFYQSTSATCLSPSTFLSTTFKTLTNTSLGLILSCVNVRFKSQIHVVLNTFEIFVRVLFSLKACDTHWARSSLVVSLSLCLIP